MTEILTSAVFDVARLYSHLAAGRRYHTRRLSPVQARHVAAIVLGVLDVYVVQTDPQRVGYLAPVFAPSAGCRVPGRSRISSSTRIR